MLVECFIRRDKEAFNRQNLHAKIESRMQRQQWTSSWVIKKHVRCFYVKTVRVNYKVNNVR